MAIIAEHINACNAFRACRAREAMWSQMATCIKMLGVAWEWG